MTAPSSQEPAGRCRVGLRPPRLVNDARRAVVENRGGIRNRSRRNCVSRETRLRVRGRRTTLFHVKHICADVSQTVPEPAPPSPCGLSARHAKQRPAHPAANLTE